MSNFVQSLKTGSSYGLPICCLKNNHVEIQFLDYTTDQFTTGIVTTLSSTMDEINTF